MGKDASAVSSSAGLILLAHMKFRDHPTDGYPDIWDFIVKELKRRQAPFLTSDTNYWSTLVESPI
ncbi:MAG: hypothetical protein EBS05_24870 [Proteobacteria bacterium]|nr:hypothetical protein [Pseudomonadota bacterium]